MLTLERELGIRQLPPGQRSKILRAEKREFVEQLGQRLSFALTELCLTIEGSESPLRPLSEDDLRARNPVGPFRVVEMARR